MALCCRRTLTMTKEAFRFSAPPLLLGLLLLLVRWYALAGLLVFLGLFVLYFFRDPNREVPSDPDLVVSPADGRVVEIVPESLDGRPGQRMSIFLSVWNVHVNRSPVAGRITRLEYRPGRFYAALRSRASTENEQNIIHIETPGGEMVFKQIAGWIARRVVAWKKEGDTVLRGERVGMIRFGSRSDVWLPEGAEFVVKKGDTVAGGSTILARWKCTT
jgi:phosphatidylserine decarboxylase